MEYTIDYKFQKTIFEHSEEHVALIRDDSGTAVHCIAGAVVDGWTKEGIMAEAEDWIRRHEKPSRSLFDEIEQDNSYEFGESAQSRAEQERYEQTQAEHNAENAKRVAAEYGGVAIAITDTEALKAAGCAYETVTLVEDNGGATLDTVKSKEWVKDGRILTVICQDYFLVV